MLAAHAELTLTGLYNVLVKVGAGETAQPGRSNMGTAPLTAKEKITHEKGLVAVLKSLPELLATLVTLGRARQLDDGRWLG